MSGTVATSRWQRWRGGSAKAAWFVTTALRCGRPQVLLGLPEAGFGDQLLVTAVFRELRKRGQRGLWAMTYQPELFAGNTDVDRAVAPWEVYKTLTRCFGGRVVSPLHAEYIKAEERWIPPKRHVIAEQCRLAGITGSIEIRPYLHLTDSEKAAGVLFDRQVCVMSSGMSARHAMANRQWPPGNFQTVVNRLGDRYQLVQVGAASDPLLEGVADRRGLPFRPCAGILSQSLLFVGQEGFLAHLARAVDCRSVVVFGGFAHPWQTGYTSNENLYSDVPCAPCWTANRCDYERKCMTMITPDQVVAAVDRVAERQGTPLAIETVTL